VDPTHERNLGEVLVRRGLLSAPQLDHALRLVASSPQPVRLAQVLVDHRVTSREAILAALQDAAQAELGGDWEASTVFEAGVTAPPPRGQGADARRDEDRLETVGPAGQAAGASEPSGKRLGAYQLVGELGRGGMGVVYEAFDPRLERTVAIKTIRGETSEGLARFEREARLASKLRHPGIAGVHEIVLEGPDAPYLVLEYVPGVPLKEVCKREVLSGKRAASLVMEIALAIESAHAEGIIHRDLKPQNVIVRPDGSPSVLDFGIAKRLNSDSLSLTKSGAVLGTPAYMAPEQASGEKVGPLADVYALGAILYECLTGRAPFSGPQIQVLYSVLHKDPPLPQSVRKIHRDLQTICLHCMEKSPANRYPSAGALALDLRNYLEGEPIGAQVVPAWRRVARSAWRQKARSVAILLTLGVLVAVPAGLYAWVELEAKFGEQSAESAQKLKEESEARVSAEELGREAKLWRTEIEQASAALTRLQEILNFRYQPLGKTEEAEERIARDARRSIAAVLGTLDGCVGRAPRSPYLHVLQGQAHLLLARVDRAKASAQAALALDTQHRSAQLLLARALVAELTFVWYTSERTEAEAKKSGAQAEALFRQAEQGDHRLGAMIRVWRALAAQQPDEAEQILAEVGQGVPSEEVHFARASIVGRRGKGDAMIEHLQRALSTCPRHVPSLRLLAVLRLEKLEFATAEKLLTRLLQLDPELRGLRSLRSRARNALGDLQGAEDDLTRVIEEEPEGLDYSNRARIRLHDNRFPGALSDLAEAIRLDARPEDFLVRADLRSRTGDHEGAARDLELAEGHAESSYFYGTRAAIRARARDRVGAKADYDRALELDPKNPRAALGRAELLLLEGDPRIALELSEQVLKIHPEDEHALLVRAKSRLYQRELAGAKDDLERVIRNNPRSLVAFEKLIQIKLQLGDLGGALADAEAALRVNPRSSLSHAMHSSVLFEKRDPKAALAAATRALALDDREPCGYRSRAKARGALGDFKGALSDANRAVELAPLHTGGYALRAFAYYQVRDFAQANADVRRALQLNPKDTAAHFLSGLILLVQGDAPGAQAKVDEAIRLGPPSSMHYTLRARALTVQGKLDAALVDLAQAIKLDPKEPEPRASRARIYLHRKDLTRALESVNAALRLAPADPHTLSLRGGIFRRQGDHGASLRDFERALEIAPELPTLWFNRGLAHKSRGAPGDRERAIRDYTKAIDLGCPDKSDVLEERAYLLRLQGDLAGAKRDLAAAVELSAKDADIRVAYGEVLERQGDLPGAVVQFTAAIELEPTVLLHWVARGGVQKDLEAALRDFDEALRLDPQRSATYVNRGVAKSRFKDREGAVADYTRALDLKPGYALARRNRAVSWEVLGKNKSALSDYDAALHLAPSAKWHVERGRLRRKLSDLEGAIRDFSAAIALEPKRRSHWSERASAKRAKKDLVGAIRDSDEAVRLAPDWADEYANRGVAKYLLSDLSGALADYSKAIELRPKHALALENRALARRNLKDFAGAVADLARVLELDPKRVKAVSMLAKVRLKQGEWEKASALFDRVVGLSESYSNVHRSRGWVRLLLGRLEPAEASYSRRIKRSGLPVSEIVLARANRAIVRVLRGEFDLALADLDAALKVQPEYPKTWFQRAAVYDLRGEGAKAAADRRRGTEAAAASSEKAKRSQSQLDAVLSAFEQAARRRPKDARTRIALGLARAFLRDHHGATQDFAAAAQLGPPPELKQAILRYSPR
jgi:tetratricopeptide (TPR) repeat protein